MPRPAFYSALVPPDAILAYACQAEILFLEKPENEYVVDPRVFDAGLEAQLLETWGWRKVAQELFPEDASPEALSELEALISLPENGEARLSTGLWIVGRGARRGLRVSRRPHPSSRAKRPESDAPGRLQC